MSWPSDGEPRFIYRTVTGYSIGAEGATSGRPIGTSHMILDRAYCHRLVYEEPHLSPNVDALLDLLNAPNTEWRGLDLCARLRDRGKRAKTAREWLLRHR